MKRDGWEWEVEKRQIIFFLKNVVEVEMDFMELARKEVKEPAMQVPVERKTTERGRSEVKTKN